MLRARCCGRRRRGRRGTGLALARSRSRLGILRSVPGIRLGVRFGFGLGTGFAARGTALGSVVVHIPPGALEVQARGRKRPLQDTVALGALGLLLGAEVLDLFEFMTAFGTAIRIQRQGSLPPGDEITRCVNCTGKAAKSLQMRGRPRYFGCAGCSTTSYSGNTSTPMTFAVCPSTFICAHARASR